MVCEHNPKRAAELCEEYNLPKGKKSHATDNDKKEEARPGSKPDAAANASSATSTSSKASSPLPSQGPKDDDKEASAIAAAAEIAKSGSFSEDEGDYFEHNDSVPDDNTWKIQGNKGICSKPNNNVSRYLESTTISSSSSVVKSLPTLSSTTVPLIPPCKKSIKVYVSGSNACKMLHMTADVAVANSGTTHHLWPNFHAFISFLLNG